MERPAGPRICRHRWARLSCDLSLRCVFDDNVEIALFTWKATCFFCFGSSTRLSVFIWVYPSAKPFVTKLSVKVDHFRQHFAPSLSSAGEYAKTLQGEWCFGQNVLVTNGSDQCAQETGHEGKPFLLYAEFLCVKEFASFYLWPNRAKSNSQSGVECR